MYVLGCDPGLKNFGYVVIDLESLVHAEVGVFVTEKSRNKVLVAEDNMRRAQELAEYFRDICEEYQPVAICTEGMSFPQNSGAATKIALSWGVVAAVAEANHLPIVQTSPQALKKKLCGRRNATKKDVEDAVMMIWPWTAVSDFQPKGLREHVVDAYASVICAADSEIMKMARRMM